MFCVHDSYFVGCGEAAESQRRKAFDPHPFDSPLPQAGEGTAYEVVGFGGGCLGLGRALMVPRWRCAEATRPENGWLTWMGRISAYEMWNSAKRTMSTSILVLLI